jgi:hypothetical protein
MGWVLIAIALLFNQGAQAADISLVADGTPDYPAIVLINGKLDRDSAGVEIETFGTISSAQRYGAVIVLESPGGTITTAIAIGREIRQRGYSTLVADNAFCASTCGLIWVAGKERFPGPRARVGFHAAKEPNGEVSAHGNAVVGAYLHEMGITNMQVISHLTKVTPSGMTWLSLDEAKRLKIDVKPLRGDLAMRTTRR